MKNNKKIAVIGGSGKAGKYLVKELLDQQFNVKLLLRDPDKFPVNNPLVEVQQGNVTDTDSIETLISDCDAVISTLGLGIPPSEPTIFSQSATHVINAMMKYNVRRYVVITGLNVDTPFDRKSPKTAFGTDWMKKNYPVSTADKQLEYEILVKSTVEWTLVRLPMIELTEERRKVKVSIEDCSGDSISAADLAHFLVEQLEGDEFVHQAPFIWNE